MPGSCTQSTSSLDLPVCRYSENYLSIVSLSSAAWLPTASPVAGRCMHGSEVHDPIDLLKCAASLQRLCHLTSAMHQYNRITSRNLQPTPRQWQILAPGSARYLSSAQRGHLSLFKGRTCVREIVTVERRE
jgi:hypothetical protein